MGRKSRRNPLKKPQPSQVASTPRAMKSFIDNIGSQSSTPKREVDLPQVPTPQENVGSSNPLKLLAQKARLKRGPRKSRGKNRRRSKSIRNIKKRSSRGKNR